MICRESVIFHFVIWEPKPISRKKQIYSKMSYMQMREMTHFKKCIYYLLQKKRQRNHNSFFFLFLFEVFRKNVLAFVKECDGVRVIFFLITYNTVMRNLWSGFAKSFCEETDSEFSKNLYWIFWTGITTFHCLPNLDRLPHCFL